MKMYLAAATIAALAAACCFMGELNSYKQR